MPVREGSYPHFLFCKKMLRPHLKLRIYYGFPFFMNGFDEGPFQRHRNGRRGKNVEKDRQHMTYLLSKLGQYPLHVKGEARIVNILGESN
jgi:hypothetical protein